MTSEVLEGMFQCDFADTRAGKFPLVSMGRRANGLVCADLGARTLIWVGSWWIRQNIVDEV